MKTTYVSVVTALVSLAAARPGVQCVADGNEVSDPGSCQTVLDNYSETPDKTITISGGSYSLGCETECYAVIYPRDGNEITITYADVHSDIQQIVDQCGDGPFKGTFQEASGENARRTEITAFEGSVC